VDRLRVPGIFGISGVRNRWDFKKPGSSNVSIIHPAHQLTGRDAPPCGADNNDHFFYAITQLVAGFLSDNSTRRSESSRDAQHPLRDRQIPRHYRTLCPISQKCRLTPGKHYSFADVL
jgi:hypothetical protein